MLRNLCLALILSFSALSYGQSNASQFAWTKDWKLKANTNFYAYSIEGKRSEAQIGGIGLNIQVENKIGENLHFYADAGVRLENGSHKSLDVAEFSPNQQVLLNEGHMYTKFFDSLTLKLGAINQGHFHSPLFIDANAFMGAQETWQVKWGEYSFYLQAQQLIPNNRNLSTRLATIDEGTPKFFSETLGLNLGGNVAQLDLALSLYAFSNLSNSVAHQSRFMGNSVAGIGTDAAEFVYSYKGSNARAQLWFEVAQLFALRLTGHYTKNSQAPSARDTAMLMRASLEFSRWTFFGQWFESESDASVAFYNDRFLGHNNRRGQGVGLSFDEGKGKIQLDLIQSRPIEFNIFQDKSTNVLLRFSREIM